MQLSGQVSLDWTNGQDSDGSGPWAIEVTNNAGSPAYGTVVGGGQPALSGTFTNETSDAFTITLQGLDTNFDPLDFTSGSAAQIRANSTGAGVTTGNGSLQTNEGILITFDSLSGMSAASSLELSAVDANTASDVDIYLNETRVSSTDLFAGITISPSDQIALVHNLTTGGSRLLSLTFDVIPSVNASPPSNLRATVVDWQVQLDWDENNSETFDFFTIYRSTSSPVTTDDEVLAVKFNSGYFDVTADNNTTYYYAVTATGLNGVESALSTEVSAMLAEPGPIQQLDASQAASVVGSPVVQWTDQSGSGNNASAAVGSVFYTGSGFLESGLAGIEFGSVSNSLALFSSSESDAWLDQSASADGFCVLIAFKCNQLVSGGFNDLLGNSTNGIAGLQIGYTSSGQIQAFLGGQQIASTGDQRVQPGDTVVIALNYNADTQTYELWETKNFASVTGSLSRQDFSTANAVTLGSIDVSSQFLNGIVGEVRIFDTALDDGLFRKNREALLHRWVSPPNIIMILGDDMAWYDTPVLMDDRMLNSAQYIMRRLEDPENPGQLYRWNMQRLADEGMLFRNAYSAAPQCTPTRGSLQTGQTTARNRVGVFLSGSSRYSEYDARNSFSNYPVIPNGIELPFPDTMVTIPEALSPMGYYCAHYGKWHLSSDPAVEGYIESDGDTNNDEGKTYDSNNEQIPVDIENPKDIKGITDRTIEFLNNYAANGKPVYIQLSHYAVHNPWECYPSSRALFQNDPDILANNKGETDVTQLNRKRDYAVFFGMLYDLDQSIGRILDEIEALGMLNNTYIVFKSDNGYRRFNGDEVGQPHYGDKWFLWQGGLRIPMSITGPGIPGGQISTANVVTYDLLPTFYDWAGGDPQDLANIDGVSLEGLLEGETPWDAFLDRSLYFHYPHYRSSMPMSAIVKGKYKLAHSWDGTIRTDISMENPNMLFDLSKDPGEFNNINTSPGDNETASLLWADLDSYLSSVSAWRPLNNEQAFLADGGASFSSNSDKDKFPPFEGSRGSGSSPVDDWFESWGVNLGGDEEDYDLDGVFNLLEYALGRNPTFAESPGEGAPIFEIRDGEWLFSFAQRAQEGGLDYTVWTSVDLTNWTQLTDENLQISRSGSDFDWVEAVLPDQSRVFVRLEVSR
ncbi:MAG: sulfatase-like hydrolase/transferase [Verrucomicrobiota bacterium]